MSNIPMNANPVQVAILRGCWNCGSHAISCNLTRVCRTPPTKSCAVNAGLSKMTDLLNDAYRAWRRYCIATDMEPTAEYMRIWQEGWLFAQEEVE